MKKAISILSAVIFVGFTISMIAIVYQTGMPIIERMQSSAAVENIKSSFIELDERIQRAASEANGSKRTLSFRIEPGDLVVDDVNDLVYWVLDTEAPVYSPRTATYYGSMSFGSNLETNTYEENYMGTDSYVLENDHLKVYIKKLGSSTSMVSYETGELLVAIYQKDQDQWMNGKLEIMVDSNSLSGTGYTELRKEGKLLPYGEVVAYMDSVTNYFINFTLESGADFITIEGALA
jgi:hypothetical protein